MRLWKTKSARERQSSRSLLASYLRSELTHRRAFWPLRAEGVSGKGRMPPASYRSRNACLRRNLAVHQGLDEGRIAVPFADPHHCGVHDLRPRKAASESRRGQRKRQELQRASRSKEGLDALATTRAPSGGGGSHGRLDRRQKTGGGSSTAASGSRGSAPSSSIAAFDRRHLRVSLLAIELVPVLAHPDHNARPASAQ